MIDKRTTWEAAAPAAAAALLAAIPVATMAIALRRAFAATAARATLRELAIALAVALVVQIVCAIAAARIVRTRLADRTERLRVQTIEALRDLPAAQATAIDAGRTVALLTTGLDAAAEAIAGNFAAAFGGSIAAVASLAVVAAIDWRIALVALVFLPVTVGYARQSRSVTARTTPRFARARAEGSSRFFEYVASIGLLRAFGAGAERTRRLGWALRELQIKAFETTIAPISFGTIALFYVDFGFAITLMAGTQLGIASSSGIAYVLALALTLGYFATLFDVVDATLRLHDARANLHEVEGLLACAAAAPRGCDDLPAGTALALDDVAFAFDARPILNGISHVFAERAVTAIVGRSGAGKSVLASLLGGLRAPAAGAVTIGGVDLAGLSRNARTRSITVVFQDTSLADGTIAQNIAAGNPDASDDDVRRAATAARCDELLARLPHGLDTHVRADGIAFSLGERQRIAIARALLSPAPVIVFDECTASLDPAAERAVHRALDALAATKTVVLITHRLASARAARAIVVLAGGTFAERGSHDELVALGGEYATLWAAYEQPRRWREAIA